MFEQSFKAVIVASGLQHAAVDACTKELYPSCTYVSTASAISTLHKNIPDQQLYDGKEVVN